MAKITPIPALKDNYIWLIEHEALKKALVVDPGDAAPVIEILQKKHLKLAGILITHHHWDHTDGIAALLEYEKVPVYGPSNDPVPAVTHKLADGDRITIPELNFTFEILDIPGHTKGHIAFVGLGGVFCGDTLFSSGCGKFFEGTAEQIYHSLQKLAHLPDETAVYAAHEYTLQNLQFAMAVEPHNPDIQKKYVKTQKLRDNGEPSLPSYIKNELDTNPFLRCENAQVIATANKKAGKTLNNPAEVYATLRAWKDSFKS